MANSWNIPEWLEQKVLERDSHCIYCNVDFSIAHNSRKTMPTWEHIENDARIITPENIARCCSSCNASKGVKDLKEWLKSSYCKRKQITNETIAPVARRALEDFLQLEHN